MSAFIPPNAQLTLAGDAELLWRPRTRPPAPSAEQAILREVEELISEGVLSDVDQELEA